MNFDLWNEEIRIYSKTGINDTDEEIIHLWTFGDTKQDDSFAFTINEKTHELKSEEFEGRMNYSIVKKEKGVNNG